MSARREPRRASAGYTIVEVMMALAVLTLGAAGVIALQKATLIANTNARNLATATAIGQAWMERLRIDALGWNEMASLPDIAQTAWLGPAGTAAPANGAGWFTPTTVAFGGTLPAGSPTADVLGADLYAGDEPKLVPAFCTQVRLTRFAGTKDAALGALYRSMRIEVRVLWDRLGQQVDCATLPAGWDVEVGRYGTVYLVSAAMENPAPF